MTLITYRQWTTQNYHQAIEQGLFENESVELLQGEIVIMSPERKPHAYYNSEVADYLRTLLGNQAKIRDAKPITLPHNSEPEPDIAIVQPLGSEYLEHHPFPENIFWIIEFSQATLSKDLGKKKDVYAEAGIVEYWVVDLKNNQLRVFRDLLNKQYTSELTLNTGVIASIAFPKILIEVQKIIN